MNVETIEKLSNVIQVLGNIEVKGKNNLLNLGGAITFLEEIRQDYISSIAQDKQSKETKG